MAPLPRSAFARRLRRVAPDEFVAFVADLWRARGWEVAVDGRTLEATREGTTRTLIVLPTTVAVAGFLGRRDAGDVDGVVTRGRLAARSAATLRSIVGPDVLVYGPADLHQRLWYGVADTARRGLLERYFDLDAAAVDAVWNEAPTADDRSHGGALPSGRRAAVAGIALVMVGSLIGGVLLAFDRPGASPSGAATPGLAGLSTAAPAPSPTPSPSPTISGLAGTGCPAPPVNRSAARLRPDVSAATPEAVQPMWRVTLAQNITRFDILDERTDVVPDDRYTAMYRDRAGNRFRLEIDHWESRALARADAAREANRSDLWLVWGRYTVAVRGYDADWAPLPPEAVRSPALRLVARMEVPGEGRLGLRCVSYLASARPVSTPGTAAGPSTDRGGETTGTAGVPTDAPSTLASFDTATPSDRRTSAA